MKNIFPSVISIYGGATALSDEPVRRGLSDLIRNSINHQHHHRKATTYVPNQATMLVAPLFTEEKHIKSELLAKTKWTG